MGNYIGVKTRSSGAIKKRAVIAVVLLAICLIVVAFFTVLETTPPKGEWLNRSEYLGKAPTLKFSASDKGRGLKEILVTYNEGGKIKTLYSMAITGEGVSAKERTIEVRVDFAKDSIKDGTGTVTLKVTDNSLWNFGKGNSFFAEYPVVIDTRPPSLSLLSRGHVVVKGGAEAALFKSSDDTVRAGIEVAGRFFPAHLGALKDPEAYISIFSYPYDTEPGEPIFIVAEDRAGNIAKKNLPAYVKNATYRKRRINISDDFLTRKLPELLSASGLTESPEPIDDFLRVNGDLRRKMNDRIDRVTKESEAVLLWKGGFSQVRNAAVQALFADHRTYYYKGEPIDRQYHLGYDLAATKRYPIGASNSGKVVFADYLGIYGNTVIIDHGIGVFTLYSHLSSMSVDAGERVTKGDTVGRTGETGLAGGDHLHFAVLIHGIPVTPVEWWDGTWVKNRVYKKIEAAVGLKD